MKKKNNVKKYREDRLMTKAALARDSRLSVLTIDRIERGENCRLVTMRRILDAFGLTVEDRDKVFPREPDPDQ